MHKTKIFLDIEKEINWLNKMSEQGFRLVKKDWYTYFFESCSPNKYIYQIEKRSGFFSKLDDNYIEFLSDLDITLVTMQWGWYYFEKENNNKPFDIYSDMDSKILHFKNCINVLLIFAFFSIVFTVNCINSPVGSRGPYILNLSVPLIANPLIFLFSLFTAFKHSLKIKVLRKQQRIIE